MKGWAELKEAFWACVDSDPDERARRAEALAAIDPALPARLEALLAADARGESLDHLFESLPAAAPHPERIGEYDVLGVLGSGGMGEVYRARDWRLERDVAIKVIPQAVVGDPDRRARFEREARVLASLNHPHVAQVYGLAQSGSAPALVMELVDGPTLERVIAGQAGAPLTVADALTLASQLADGLDAAHQKGIVHRDLKPSNVALTSDGKVKILDFGIAKSVDATVSPGAAVTTGAGLVLGTPAYMSPEQARGLPIDRRTDVWAFGCLLFEMLTGHQAFPGRTPSDSVAAVLQNQPNLAMLPPGTPAAVQSLLRHCLDKDPGRRLRDIADARLVLDDARADAGQGARGSRASDAGRPAAAAAVAALAPGRAGRLRSSGARWLGGAALLALAALAVGRLSMHGVDAPAVVKVVPLTLMPGFEISPSISPDGTRLAFAWKDDDTGKFNIHVKLVGGSDVHQLTADGPHNMYPRWSPDGRLIAYLRLDQNDHPRLRVMTALGGSDRPLSDTPVLPGIDWSPDSRFVAAVRVQSPSKVLLFPAAGGEPRAVLRSTAAHVVSPAFSPEGRRLAYATCDDPIFVSKCIVHVVDLAATLSALGDGRQLTPKPTWRIDTIAWSHDGRSVIYGADEPELMTLWRVAADGSSEPERIEAAGLNAMFPSVTPAGELAFSRQTSNTDVYTVEQGREASAVARSSLFDGNPQVSPDGTRVAFCSVQSGEAGEIWTVAADGTDPRQLTRGPGRWQCSPTWSPDGRRIAFDTSTVDGNWHIWMIDAAGGGTRTSSPSCPGTRTCPRGRTMASGSTSRGRPTAPGTSGGCISPVASASASHGEAADWWAVSRQMEVRSTSSETRTTPHWWRSR